VAVRNLGGGPEKYKPEYCDQLVEFFLNAATAPAQMATIFEIDGPGNPAVNKIKKCRAMLEVQTIVAVLPTFTRFALSIRANISSIQNWRAKYPDFDEACQMAKDIQRDFLIQGLISGRIPATGGIFVAKNIAGMKDRADPFQRGVPLMNEMQTREGRSLLSR
jgi:hypothetical protein